MAREIVESAHSTLGTVPGVAHAANPRLVFIPIPKCAGTAVTRAIRSAYFPVHRELWSRLRGRPGYAFHSIRIESSYDTVRRDVEIYHRARQMFGIAPRQPA